MEAPHMAVMDTPTTNHLSSDYAAFGTSNIRCLPRAQAAFEELLKALEYAHELNTSVWDFAIELYCLRRLQLSNSDLRWLVAKGLIAHAIETTAPGDVDRSFKRPATLLLCKTACFVLTPRGAAFSREICSRGSEQAEHCE